MSNARNLARLLPNASGQLPDAAMSSGSVLQVVQAVNTTQTSFSSTSETTLMSASITPTRTSSKILVLVNFASVGKAGTGAEGYYSLWRDSSKIVVIDGVAPYTGGVSTAAVGSVGCNYLDSPSTTSPVTYSAKASSNGDALVINWEGGTSTITLMEIAA